MKSCLTVLALVLATVPAAGDTQLRIVTYNIHHGEGTDRQIDIPRLAKIIRDEHPDIVCLQEVDQGVERSQRIDIPAEMAKALDMNVAYGPNLDLQGGRYGNATLTQFAILEQENIALPTPEGQEPRGCLRVRIDIDGRSVDVFNTHLGLTPDQRKEQAAAIQKRIGEGPAILAGDLNETADGAGVKSLASVLVDSGGVAGDGEGSIGHGERKRRIDFILVSRHMDVISSRVIVTPETSVASDHRPVVADVSLGASTQEAKAQGIYDVDDERVEEAVGVGETWHEKNSK